MLAAPALAAEQRPNVVLILADDQAYTDYGFMGHKLIQTPHLDRLAKESKVFTRGYVPTSLCRASLMTLVTGLYPHEHGIVGNDPPKGTDRTEMLKFVRNTPTLPRVLSKAGYRTFQAGKWWEGSYQDGGFTHGMTHGDPAKGGRHGDLGLKIGREGLQPIYDFIEASGDKPFFVWYAPMLPHQPHNPPERLLAKYRDKVESLHVAKYYAMCEWWDETCGELLDYLDKKKLSDNTLVVYVCDNGWIQQPDKAAFDPRSKRSPYEAGIRTPIMFRWPGHVKPMIDDGPQTTKLIAGTILNECRITDSKISAWPPLTSCPLPGPVFGEIYEHDVADIDRPAKSLTHRWAVLHRWKLIVSADGKREEFYDLKEDPQEQNNLAGKAPKELGELRAMLDKWWKP
jgi:uncharacterized sulfatase